MNNNWWKNFYPDYTLCTDQYLINSYNYTYYSLEGNKVFELKIDGVSYNGEILLIFHDKKNLVHFIRLIVDQLCVMDEIYGQFRSYKAKYEEGYELVDFLNVLIDLKYPNTKEILYEFDEVYVKLA